MDVSKLLQGFLGDNQGQAQGGKQGKAPGGMSSGLVGGAAAGGMIALLLGTKKGRKLGGKALKYGGMAAVGGLAYKAYRDWQAGKAVGSDPAPLALEQPGPETGFDVENDRDAEGTDFRLVLVQAMIAAANADDHIDAEEHRHIRAQVDELGLGPSEKALLYDYLSDPADAAGIAALARTEEQKAEIYLASALAIDPDTGQERAYLSDLAARLNLPEGLSRYLDGEAASVRMQPA